MHDCKQQHLDLDTSIRKECGFSQSSSNDPIQDIPNTAIQILLDQEASLSNSGNKEEASTVQQKIRDMRGNEAPCCFGHDDCSTFMLIQCPWRFDCGD